MLSADARDRLEAGCPLDASASEVARHGPSVSASFADAFERLVSLLEQSLGERLSKRERRQRAIATVAAKVGAIAVSRALLAANRQLADEVLEATRMLTDASDAQ
jgi:TetR/AcrR family transcriptional repressor of nem operon